jgi:hypothetical protein
VFSSIIPISIGDNVNNKDSGQVNISDVQPGVSWVKTFGLPVYNDDIYSVRQTSDGGYIMTGVSRSYSSDHFEDAWLFKTDKYGNEEWSKTFGESGGLNIDEGHSVQQTTDGGYVFFGNTFSFDAPGHHSEGDAWLVKTNPDGNEEWNETFGGSKTEHGNSVFQTSDGGYILAGWNTSSPSGNAWLFKTDKDGVEEWSKNFYHGYSATGLWVQQTSDSGYIMTGVVYIDRDNGFLVKTDKDGNEQWNKTYCKPRYNGFNSVQQTPDDGFIACGSICNDLGLNEAWLVKIDKYGNEQWNRTFNDPPTFSHYAYEVDQTNDGGFIVISNCHEGLLYNSWLIKTDSNGNKEWQLDIEGTEFHDSKLLNSGQQTSDGGYIIAGINGNSDGDGLLIKIDNFENQPPSPPTIKGPKKGLPYLPLTYTAVSNDPDGDKISYFFDWNDNSFGAIHYTLWTEPFGVSASRSHSWKDSGVYTIKVKAMDEHYAQSDWTTYEVNLPRTRALFNSNWLNFLDHFPIFKEVFTRLIKE